jgi:hypothetical protein
MSQSDQDLSARANRKAEDMEAYPTISTPVQVVDTQATDDTAGSRPGLDRRVSARLEEDKVDMQQLGAFKKQI